MANKNDKELRSDKAKNDVGSDALEDAVKPDTSSESDFVSLREAVAGLTDAIQRSDGVYEADDIEIPNPDDADNEEDRQRAINERAIREFDPDKKDVQEIELRTFKDADIETHGYF